MWNNLKDTFVADFKIILHDKKLLIYSLFPFLIVIFLLFVFSAFSAFVYSKTGFPVNEYYSLIAITFVCIVPALIGSIYSGILQDDKNVKSLNFVTNPAEEKSLLYLRMLFPAFISFVLVWLTVLLVKPVPTEGWLRNLFIACLLSIQAPFVCLLIGTFGMKKVKRLSLFILCSMFLITVPFGLLVHHPWNYFAFFSPLYWVAWSWVIRSPMESLTYGSIAVILTLAAVILLIRQFSKNITI